MLVFCNPTVNFQKVSQLVFCEFNSNLFLLFVWIVEICFKNINLKYYELIGLGGGGVGGWGWWQFWQCGCHIFTLFFDVSNELSSIYGT